MLSSGTTNGYDGDLPKLDCDPQEDLAAFDRLPPSIRSALRNCVVDLAAPSILDLLLSGASEREILREIRVANMEAIVELRQALGWQP